MFRQKQHNKLTLNQSLQNDYADNIPSLGITSIYKWIKETSRRTTAQGLVTAFSTRHQCNPALFGNALQVFSLLSETALTDDESNALQMRQSNLSNQYEILSQVLNHTTHPLIPRTKKRAFMELNPKAEYPKENKK